MRFCLPLFLLLLVYLPVSATLQPAPEPFLGLKWGMNQFQVEDALAKDEALLPQSSYILLNVGTTEYHARRYGTYLIASVPMDLVCGFGDADYTDLKLVSLRYSGRSFSQVVGIYELLADLFTVKLLGVEPGRDLRARERRPSRQDRVIDWVFDGTRFHMRAWGSEANGRISVLFQQVGSN